VRASTPGGWLVPLIAAFALGAPATASADRGERWLGLAVVGEVPRAAGLDGTLQLGLGDALSSRLSLGARLGADGLVVGVASAGLAVAWDVVAWVPELGVRAGLRVRADSGGDRVAGEGALELGLTRYLSLGTALRLSLAGGWRTTGTAFGLASVGIAWRG
jgi:hypothetical protein